MSQAPDTLAVRDMRPGYYRAENEIIDVFGPRLKAHGIAVYNCLSRYAGKTEESFPSMKTIADSIGCSERQVQREIDKLIGFKLIARANRADTDGKQISNLYYLLSAKEAAKASPKPAQTQSRGRRKTGGSDSESKPGGGQGVTRSLGRGDSESAKENPSSTNTKPSNTTDSTGANGGPGNPPESPKPGNPQPEPASQPPADPASKKPAASGKRPSLAEVDPRGIPINRSHPRWDQLWDAFAGLPGIDPSLDSTRSEIGKAVKALLKSKIEYIDQDVQHAAGWWGEAGFKGTPTISGVAKWISQIRQDRLGLPNYANPKKQPPAAATRTDAADLEISWNLLNQGLQLGTAELKRLREAGYAVDEYLASKGTVKNGK